MKDLSLKRLMRSFKNVFVYGGFLCLVLFFSYKMIFTDMSFKGLVGVLKAFDVRFLVAGFFCIGIMLCCDCVTMWRSFRLCNERQSFFRCIYFTFVGCFFCGITPAASGGQPMQLVAMKRRKVDVSKGSLVLFMEFCVYQAVVLLWGIVGFILYFRYINEVTGKFVILFWIGIVINLLLFGFFCTLVFSEKLILKIVKFVGFLVGLFNNNLARRFMGKGLEFVDSYRDGALFVRKNLKGFLVNALIVFVRVFAMNCFVFIIYRGFGFKSNDILFFASLQSALFISFASIPLPGGAGIGEKGFLVFFKGVFPENLMSYGMILYRCFSSYLPVVFCGMCVFLFVCFGRRNKVLNGV